MLRMVGLSLILLSNLSFASDVFDYVLKSYPKKGNCQAVVAPLTRQFQQATGLEVYWSGVTAEPNGACDIKITYLANEKLSIASNVDKENYYARKATRATQAECIADLPREVELFKNATQVEPWVSYCYYESSYLKDFNWIPVVEGFGKGNQTLFATQTIFSIVPVEGWQKSLSSIFTSAHAQGISVASVVSVPNVTGNDKEITVRFYAKERRWLQTEKFAHYTAPLVCESQVEQVKADLMKAATPPVAVYCGKYFDNEKYLAIATLSYNILELANIRAKEDSKTYPSLESCREAVPTTLDFYKSKLGKNALAGICSDNAGLFRITVFTEKI